MALTYIVEVFVWMDLDSIWLQFNCWCRRRFEGSLSCRFASKLLPSWYWGWRRRLIWQMAVWLIIGNCTPTSITAKTNSKFSMQKGQKYRFSNIKCHIEWREIAWCKNICLQEYIRLCSIVLNNKQKTTPYWGWCTKARGWAKFSFWTGSAGFFCTEATEYPLNDSISF